MSNLRLLVKKSCTQLEGKYLDEEQANQVAKNIAFIACAMQAAPESAVVQQQGKPTKANSGQKRPREGDDENDASQEQADADVEGSGVRPRLWWLFRQLSYLARNQGNGFAVVKRKVMRL